MLFARDCFTLKAWLLVGLAALVLSSCVVERREALGIPDIVVVDLERQIPGVCNTTSGICQSLGVASSAVGVEWDEAPCWIAELLRASCGDVGGPMFPNDVQDLSALGDGLLWNARVVTHYGGIPVPQLEGSIVGRSGGLEWHIPSVVCAAIDGGEGAKFGVKFAADKAQRRIMESGAAIELLEKPILVYARPESDEYRAALRWPSERRGRVFRPSWMVSAGRNLFVDATTGLFWAISVD